jgi:hypothetical protein
MRTVCSGLHSEAQPALQLAQACLPAASLPGLPHLAACSSPICTSAHSLHACHVIIIYNFVYACPAKEPVLAPPPLYLGGRISTLVDFVFFFHCCE